jgi:DNA-binding response OmpR family regulator
LVLSKSIPSLHHVKSLDDFDADLYDTGPDLVILSSALPPQRMVEALEATKNASRDRLIPVVMLLDDHQHLHLVPGTEWNGQFGVLNQHSSEVEVWAVLRRVLGFEVKIDPRHR